MTSPAPRPAARPFAEGPAGTQRIDATTVQKGSDRRTRYERGKSDLPPSPPLAKKIWWRPFRLDFHTDEHEPQHREVASVVDIAHPADHGEARGPRGP